MLPADRILLERIGARLRELREAADLSQEAVGERAGFGGKYIGEIEKGVRDVPLSTLRAVVENGLGHQLAALFTGRGKPMPATATLHPRDVELTALAIASLPIRIRRPLLALARAMADNVPAEPRAAAAERRGAGWKRSPKP